jgi:hypothetical protein
MEFLLPASTDMQSVVLWSLSLSLSLFEEVCDLFFYTRKEHIVEWLLGGGQSSVFSEIKQACQLAVFFLAQRLSIKKVHAVYLHNHLFLASQTFVSYNMSRLQNRRVKKIEE